jgi:hypothetical protein
MRRIQLSRQRGWRKPENTVVVARPTKWGNPFRVGVHGTRADCLEKFRRCASEFPIPQDRLRLWRDAGGDTAVLLMVASRLLPQLRGRDLACWCPLDVACHADILLELAAEVPVDAGSVLAVGLTLGSPTLSAMMSGGILELALAMADSELPGED